MKRSDCQQSVPGKLPKGTPVIHGPVSEPCIVPQRPGILAVQETPAPAKTVTRPSPEYHPLPEPQPIPVKPRPEACGCFPPHPPRPMPPCPSPTPEPCVIDTSMKDINIVGVGEVSVKRKDDFLTRTFEVSVDMSKKADKTYVDSGLAKKADKTYVDAELAKKVDKTYVDAELAKKADKSSTVSDVAYDSTNKKITKTINGTTTDVVSAATLKTDMALNNVDNTSDANKPVSTAQQAALDEKLDMDGDGKDVTVTFSEASTRANIGTGEKLSVLFGKIKKWFSDLGTAAFRNVPASGNASSTEVVLGSDTRLSAGASAVQDVTVDGASVVNASTKVAAVPNASTSAKGAVQLVGSIGATVASENNKAATEKAVRDAINDLDSEVTSSDGTNVQVKVTQTDGKITGVSIVTDNTMGRGEGTFTEGNIPAFDEDGNIIDSGLSVESSIQGIADADGTAFEITDNIACIPTAVEGSVIDPETKETLCGNLGLVTIATIEL